MPNHVLLLGAGFSRNWGAPLSAEVADSLLQEVGDDAQLQSLLKQHSKNFENALSEVQRQYLHRRHPPRQSSDLIACKALLQPCSNG
jgi:hypothetical protein